MSGLGVSAEQWRPIEGYEGLYEVSNQGRVRSLDSVITDSLGRTRRQRGRVMKHTLCSFGYHRVELRAGGRNTRKRHAVHRLVAGAFVEGRTSERNVVMHLDHDPDNNTAENLAWGTQLENVRATQSAGRGRNWHSSRTHCFQGHPFDMLDSRGSRSCRECRRKAQARFVERRRLRRANTIEEKK